MANEGRIKARVALVIVDEPRIGEARVYRSPSDLSRVPAPRWLFPLTEIIGEQAAQITALLYYVRYFVEIDIVKLAWGVRLIIFRGLHVNDFDVRDAFRSIRPLPVERTGPTSADFIERPFVQFVCMSTSSSPGAASRCSRWTYFCFRLLALAQLPNSLNEFTKRNTFGIVEILLLFFCE